MKKYLFIILVFLFQANAWAAELHQVTSDLDTTRSALVPTGIGNSWLYTKVVGGYSQVFMQYHYAATDTTAFTEVQITSDSTNKSLPQMGPLWIYVFYKADNTSSSFDYNGNCTAIYYLKDDGTRKNLTMMCLDTTEFFAWASSGLSSSLTQFHEIPITGTDTTTQFDVAYFDSYNSMSSILVLQNTSTSLTAAAYQLVLTTSDDKLHYITFPWISAFYGNAVSSTVLFDPANTYRLTLGGITSVSNWSTLISSYGFDQYRHPQFVADGDAIVFEGKLTSSDPWQAGIVDISGHADLPLTQINKDIENIVPFDDGTTQGVLFNIVGSGGNKDSLGFINYSMTLSAGGVDIYATTYNVCRATQRLTENTISNRRQPDVGYDGTTKGLFDISYQLEQADGNYDIYYAQDDLACQISITAPSTSLHPNLLTTEHQLTCQDNNVYPHFIENMNYSLDHSAITSTTTHMGIMYLQAKLDSADTAIIHLHDIPTEAACLDTCYENADGTAITDTDTDGIRDDESPAGYFCDNCVTSSDNTDDDGYSDSDINTGNLVGDACEDQCLDGTSDTDVDGYNDSCDNCPETYNPDQDDLDGDGIGDWCDNCITVRNVDQADADSDGVGDACETECECCTELPDTCFNNGEEDTDGDGMDDECDNCPTTDNWNQNDSDGDGIGDACEASGEDTCMANFDGTAITDTDGDGLRDADLDSGVVCDNCPSTSNSDQVDSDGDGVGDACDNCDDDDNSDQADSDSDGIGDACEDGTTAPPSSESCIGETLTVAPGTFTAEEGIILANGGSVVHDGITYTASGSTDGWIEIAGSINEGVTKSMVKGATTGEPLQVCATLGEFKLQTLGSSSCACHMDSAAPASRYILVQGLLASILFLGLLGLRGRTGE